MRYMTCRHELPGRLTMSLLVIHEQIGSIRLKKLTFGTTTKKDGFIDPDIPGS